jgi:hypothetical protein
MIHPHAEFHILKPSSSLVIAIKPKSIDDIRTTVILLLFYVLQRKLL